MVDNVDEYLEFIQEFCNSLGDKSPIVIYEPDCIPHMEQMGVVDGMDRMSIIKSVELLSKTNALVYLDIGNPKWLSVPKVSYLTLCDIHKVKDFT